MTFRATKLATFASALVLAFPILLLCVPRGSGIFLAAVVVLALCGGHRMAKTWGTYRDLLNPLSLAILALMVVYLGSKLYFGVPWNVIDNPSRILLALLACVVFMRTVPDPTAIWRGITIALVASLAIVAIQHYTLGEERPSAWTQAIAFANMVAALGLVGFARPGTSRCAHALAWVNLVLAAMILFLNGTRGATLAMLLTALPLLFVRYRGLSAARFFAAIALFAALGVGAYLIPGGPVAQKIDQVRNEVGQFEKGDVETSAGARLEVWRIAAKSITTHPWMGVGVGQFARILHASDFCKSTKSAACNLEHAHNDVVEAAATTGLPGMLALLGIFLIPAVLFLRTLRACRSNDNALGVSLSGAGLGVVMASLISGLTQVTMAHQANIVFYAGIIGLLLGLAGVQAKLPRTAKANA
ncbi:O-antigen ligase family protein [Cupriavidus sp. 8B]